MIVIQARIPVDSERRNVAYQHIHQFIDAARAESGCLRCDAFISLEDPDSVLIHQAWRDAGDLDRHASGEALDAFLAALPQFVAGQVETTRYETAGATSVDGEDVEEADDELPGITSAAPQGVTLH